MARWKGLLLGATVGLLVLGCGSEDEKAPTSVLPPSIKLTAEPKTIAADAVTSATITVEGSVKGPVRVTTNLGELTGPDGDTGTEVTLQGDGTFTLKSACDSRTNATCAGLARLSAVDAAATKGTTQVTLLQLEICNNGTDDDGDNQVDCADKDGCPTGQSCADEAAGDPPGLVCSAAGLCDQCVPPGGATAESKESTCDDAADNDCDGKADCADADCEGGLCVTSNGGIGNCSGGACACVDTGTEVCDDWLDNDCNGKTDCEDSVCAGRACRTSTNSVGTCQQNVCVCVPTDEDCADGADNDCDALTDCEDSDCQGEVCNEELGLVCSEGDESACSVCPGGELVEATCGDGLDNDCDGQVDCADTDCDGEICGDGGLACKNGACACGGGATETNCGDNIDDDCDGDFDCADSDCRSATVGQYGKSCDDASSFGRKCDWLGTCLCPPFGAVSETNCGDNQDNDCDGKIDCLDDDCRPGGISEHLPCDAFGNTCGTTPSPQGSLCTICPSGQAVETTCGDAVDNDCDGKIDCADTDCNGQTCGLNGRTCSLLQCKCPFGLTAETTACGDGNDNDCDGQVDCLDPDCKGKSVGQYGANCDTASTFGKVCDWLGTCVCKSGASAETLCGNNIDDDCDGLVDCRDPDCQPGGVSEAKTCNNQGRVCAAFPDVGGNYCTICPGGQTAESTCGDQADNDCDGLTDCTDPNCNGLQCGPSTNQKCQGNQCVDSTTAYVLKLSSTASRIPADGLATSTIRVTLTNSQGGSIVGQDVALTIDGAGVWQSNNTKAIGVQTNTQGLADVVLLSDPDGGVASITAILSAFGTGAQTSVEMPVLADAKFVSMQSTIMGAKTSGYQEQNQITFQLFAPGSVPYPPGLAVEFSHEPSGGSTIGTPPVTPCTTPGCTVTATGVTSAIGTVSIVLHSGTVADTRTVSVEGTAGGNTRTATSPNIAIVGAKASGSKVSLTCTPRNVPGFANHNCIKSLVDGQITCTVTLADRFNNVLGVSTVATFASEAGVVGPPAATPQYPSATLGRASTYININGGDLPIDVAPLAGIEESQTVTTTCGTLVHNPRDGSASVLVMVPGEEGFVDVNGDGVYTLGEPFIDLPEPFVDANDNNTKDGNEFYLDVSGNGQWDGPNGVWDANTTMWAETRVVYSGTMYVSQVSGTPFSRFVNTVFTTAPGDITLLTPPSFDIKVGINNDFGFVVTDARLNVLPWAGFGKVAYTTAVIGPVTFSVLNSLPPVRQEGFFFGQEYCTPGASPICGPTCPPAGAPTATRCVPRSTYGDFEYGLVGNVRLRGTAAGTYSTSFFSTTAGYASTMGASGNITP
jgi:hypothetical protein